MEEDSNLEELGSTVVEGSSDVERPPLQLEIEDALDETQPMSKHHKEQDLSTEEHNMHGRPESLSNENLTVSINVPTSHTTTSEFTERFRDDTSKYTGNNSTTQNSSSHASSVSGIDQVYEDASIYKFKSSLQRISGELFEFSRQYKQLEHDMQASNEEALEIFSSEMCTRGSDLELWQKFRTERQRLIELVGTMLQNCNIEEMSLNCNIVTFHETCSEKNNNSGNGETVPGICGKGVTGLRESRCQEILSLKKENEELKTEVVRLSCGGSSLKDECQKTERNSFDSFPEDNLNRKKDENQTNGVQTDLGLMRELEELQKKYKKMTNERNGLQEKVFEVESELCSVEIERDLKNETARYLEEQVSSARSTLTLKENELVSSRKRYKLVNEAFQNSEELRERLERETSGLTVIIRELEERLEVSQGTDKETLNESHVVEELLVAEQSKVLKDVERLEGEIVAVNEALGKERALREGVEEMLTNVEKERSLLLKELDILKDAHQRTLHEVEEFRKKIHHTSKQQQQQQLEQQQQKQQEQQHELQQQKEEEEEQQQQQKTKQITELLENIPQLSRRILLLEDENKKLEEEIYQQLEVTEKVETENKVLRQEREYIGLELKKIGLETVEELIADYHVLKDEMKGQEDKLRRFETLVSNHQMSGEDLKTGDIDLDDPDLYFSSKVEDGNRSRTFYSVPRSEYVKLKFQLKSLSEEMKFLKEVTGPGAVKNMSVTAKNIEEERTSLKQENKVVKKWLRTIKESMSVVTEEDEVVSKRFSSMLLEAQLHEARINLAAQQHEIEIIRKEKEILLTENEKQEEAMNLMKQRLIGDQEIHKNKLKEIHDKLEKLEQRLQSEVENRIKKKVVLLEEQNAELNAEFENVKQKLECFQKEKKNAEEEFVQLKLDILTYLGGASLQSVSESLNTAQKKCTEYVKIIEKSKESITKYQRDLDSSSNVNTELNTELDNVKMELQETRQLYSHKQLDIASAEKIEIDRLQAVIQALEIGKRNEQELLGAYMKEKKECENLQKQINRISTEFLEAKELLSKKEKECKVSQAVIQELETTCEVYEKEFENITIARGNNDLPAEGNIGLNLEGTAKVQEDVSENENDIENFRQLQEMVQESVAMKVQVLQNKLRELMKALVSCQNLNVRLQERLHSVEMKYLENEGNKVHGKTHEELDNELKELSEKEKLVEEMLNKSFQELCSKEVALVNTVDSEYLKDTLSRYKEVIKCLRTDNASCEEKLAGAHERIARQEEKIAGLSHHIRKKDPIEGNIELKEQSQVLTRNENNRESKKRIHDRTKFNLLENGSSSFYYSEDWIEYDQATANRTTSPLGVMTTTKNLKEQLDCVTARYVNLRAAFEGCQRRLRFLESTEEGKEFDEMVVMETESLACRAPTGVGLDNLTKDDVKEEELSELVGGGMVSNLVDDIEAQTQKNETVDFGHSYQRHISTQTDENSEDIRSFFSEISCNLTASETDLDTGIDGMVVELTLKETEIDLLPISRNVNEIDHETEDELENDWKKIEELETIVLESRDELQRVKLCSFKERVNLENTLKNSQDTNAMFTTRLRALNLGKDDLISRIKSLETKLLTSVQEIQRIKICSFNERKISDNIIQRFQDTDDKIRERVKELESEKNVLNTGNFTDCVEENANLKNLVNELEKLKTEMENQIRELDLRRESKEKDLEDCNVIVGQLRVENQALTEIISASKVEVCGLEDKVKEFYKLKEELEEIQLGMKEELNLRKDELKNLRIILKSSEANELALKEKIKTLEEETTLLRNEIVGLERRNMEEKEEELSLSSNIERSREELRVLRADIAEASKSKACVEEELLELRTTVEKETSNCIEEKEKHQRNVSNLKEIIDELAKGKQTLLEEIARLSDQKKEGQELMNNEVTRLRKTHKALQTEHEEIQDEKSKLEFRMSSFKVTMETLQSAYEQAQDENKQHERRVHELRAGQAVKNQEKQKLVTETTRLKKQVSTFENKLRNSTVENKELFSSLDATETRLLALEKEYESCKNENIVLTERLKQHEERQDENSQKLETESSSVQVNNLRKKVKEFRSKLGDEKKQRELNQFEIKNLKEKVERLTKKGREIEIQFETNRKKLLEMKTERDALEMDLESVNKRKKKDIEGFMSTIESLENELKSLKGKELKKGDEKQVKEALEIAKNENKMLEMKLVSSKERFTKENNDLKNNLSVLQDSYDSEMERFKKFQTSNQKEILDLKKSLSTIEQERDNKIRELEKLRENLRMINSERQRIEKSLNEKNTEVKKWKKEAFDYKAEIHFLRGALNILEKEGLAESSAAKDGLRIPKN